VSELVSVIIPTYNRANLLRDSIDSVLAQRYQEFQLIVIDDGSTDETEKTVSRFRDSRITYRYQENMGQSCARNTGLRMAEGEYVAFLDSDNVWVDTRLQRHVALLQQNESYDAVYGISIPFPVRARNAQDQIERPSGWITRALLLRNFIPFNSVLIRKHLIDYIGGFDESLRSAEDYDLWLRVSVYGRFLSDPQVSTLYRITPGSISSNLSVNFEANRNILRRFLAQHPDYGSFFQRSLTWSSFYDSTSEQWYGAGYYGRALADGLRSIAYAPWRLNRYVAVARRVTGMVHRLVSARR